MTQPPDGRATAPIDSLAPSATAQRFRVSRLLGDAPATVWESNGERCAIGSHPSNDLAVDDATVSRFHCEIVMEARGASVRDMGSLNGTVIDGVRVRDADLRSGQTLRLGRVQLRFDLAESRVSRELSTRTELHGLVGGSVPMRATFALLERAARSDAIVLIEGETGTGKGRAAEAIHKASARCGEPFVVVDCGAIPENLLEAELFGHEKGAFTGADVRRIGAFEEAAGGTIFLDEIGEIPLGLQPKLLRVLESREVRRVGSNQHRLVDVRVIAATNRDLREEVNKGRFRPDVYFRLAVVKVEMPPLRRRPEDIPLIVELLLPKLSGNPDVTRALRTPSFIQRLQAHAWPGNVRELRNYLQRCVVFEEPLPVGEPGDPEPQAPVADTSLDYVQARKRMLGQFEHAYLAALMAAHRGKVAAAAEHAGIDRVYFYRLLRRNGLKPT